MPDGTSGSSALGSFSVTERDRPSPDEAAASLIITEPTLVLTQASALNTQLGPNVQPWITAHPRARSTWAEDWGPRLGEHGERSCTRTESCAPQPLTPCTAPTNRGCQPRLRLCILYSRVRA